MKVLKSIVLVILGFFLFLSVSAFGLAFTADRTVLNSGFVKAQVDRLDLPSLADQGLASTNQGQLPLGMRSAVVATVQALQPQIKMQIAAAVTDIYDYLLGRTASIDLSATLKSTVLSKSLIASMVGQADITTAARNSLREELVALVPPGQQQLVTYIDQALPSVEPWLKQQVDAATGPIVDYLVGDSPTLHVVVPLDQMKTILRSSLHDAFVKSPPPELAGATLAQLDAVFNQVYQAFAAQIPASGVIDPASLGLSGPLVTQQSIADAQNDLAQAKSAIAQFRLYYALLAVFIVLLIAGIILVHREVKGATRDLGIIFLTYGALEYIGVLIGKAAVNAALKGTDLPSAMSWLRGWLSLLAADALRPLEILSLGLAIGGIVLIVVSFVYRRRPS